MNRGPRPGGENLAIVSSAASRTDPGRSPRRQHPPSSAGPDYLAAIGTRVRQARKLAGLSQHELAIRVGYTAANAISKLETGRTASIDILLLDRVAEACGVPVRFLTGRPADSPSELLGVLHRQTRLLEQLLGRLEAIEKHLGLPRGLSATILR